MSQDWRIGTDAFDYLAHNQKRLTSEERRPVIRKASDLVGPGIGAGAVAITDYNDLLATFNGYYSSAPGALYAPNSSDPFIGSVVMDPVLGGKQVFTSLVTGVEYTRVFLRSPSDESSISWGLWTNPEHVPPTAYSEFSGNSRSITAVKQSVATKCTLPLMSFIGDESTFARASTVLSILRPGVYTGYYWFRTTENSIVDTIVTEFPNADSQTYDVLYNAYGACGVFLPLHFYASNGDGFIRVTATQSTDTVQHAEFTRMHLSRIGDAPS